MLSSSRMLDRLLLLSLLSLTLTGQGQASMRGSWVGPHRYMQAYRYMPGKWSEIMPRNIPFHRNIIGKMAGNFLGNILAVMPSNSQPGILRWKTKKSNVPEGSDSM